MFIKNHIVFPSNLLYNKEYKIQITERSIEMATTNKREIIEIEVGKLKAHPENEGIYGENESVADVVEQIAAFNNRILEPLKVKKDDKDSYVIISGYRRWRAAQELGLSTVPCEITTFETPEEELAALVLYNDGRVKTIETRTREGMALERTFMVDAYLKRLKNLKQSQSEVDGASMSDETETKAKQNNKHDDNRLTRDKVAEAVKLPSGKTYERAKNVIKRVDELKAGGKVEDAKLLISVMNKAPATANDLLKIFDSLSKEDKGKIETGEANASDFILGNEEATNQTSPASFTSVMNDCKAIGNTITSMRKDKPQFKNDGQKKKYREQIESHLESLQAILKSLDEEETTAAVEG